MFPWVFLIGKGLLDSVVRMITKEVCRGYVIMRDKARGFQEHMVLQRQIILAKLNYKTHYCVLKEPVCWD